MKKLSFIACILCVVLLLSSCYISYSDRTGWDCDHETFKNTYVPLYTAKIAELKNELNLDFEERIDFSTSENGFAYEFDWYFYTPEYKIRFYGYNYEYKGDSLGEFEIILYYYGKDGEFGDYEEFEPLVCFIDEFTDYVAYDAKTDGNHFEKLYNEAYSNENKIASDNIHYDSSIGNVSYGVNLTASPEYSTNKPNYCFWFEGLLKPLI